MFIAGHVKKTPFVYVKRFETWEQVVPHYEDVKRVSTCFFLEGVIQNKLSQ